MSQESNRVCVNHNIIVGAVPMSGKGTLDPPGSASGGTSGCCAVGHGLGGQDGG